VEVTGFVVDFGRRDGDAKAILNGEGIADVDPQSQMDDRPRRKRRRPARRSSNPVVVGAVVVAAVVGIAGVVAAALYFIPARQGDSRLLGTWKSDADATIAEFKKTKPVSDKTEQGLRKIFGKLKVTYTRSTITTDFDGTVDTQPYEVVAKEGNVVALRYFSSQTQKDETARIEFVDSDTYWLEMRQAKLRECFRRVR
jgi:hypothetical protein